ALQLLRDKKIEIVLLDFDLGRGDGREFVRLARRQRFQGKILIVTAGVDKDAAADLIRDGISGIFLKHDSAALLADGIREVIAGKVWFDQEQLQNALTHVTSTSCEPRPGHFTERERQVLSGVFAGLANKEIAAQVGVSESSVKATLQQLFSKTGVRTRSQLVRIVLEQHRDQL
ncbi:MAG: response regulator transcription factor, partial [Terriglobales bacterium]